jgi:uroporphyrinogen-III synthase
LPQTVRVAVIGPATAAAVNEFGWKVSLVPTRADSEGLANAFEKEPIKGEPIALFVAERTRDVLPAALEKQGAVVTQVPLYRTMPDPTGVSVLKGIRWSRTDAVVFMSGSAAEVFATSAPVCWNESDVRLCAVGSITERRMRELRLRVDLVAQEPSAKDVIKVLEEGLNGR